MAQSNTAAVLYGIGQLRIEERPVPVPGHARYLSRWLRSESADRTCIITSTAESAIT